MGMCYTILHTYIHYKSYTYNTSSIHNVNASGTQTKRPAFASPFA